MQAKSHSPAAKIRQEKFSVTFAEKVSDFFKILSDFLKILSDFFAMAGFLGGALLCSEK